jgi:hypothetical protein
MDSYCLFISIYFLAYLLIRPLRRGFPRLHVRSFSQKIWSYDLNYPLIAAFCLYHFSYSYLLYGLQGVVMTATNMFYSFTVGLFLGYLYYRAGGNLLGSVSNHFSQMFFNIHTYG